MTNFHFYLGQQEAVQMREQISQFIAELGELKSTISELQSAPTASVGGKKCVPKDLSVS